MRATNLQPSDFQRVVRKLDLEKTKSKRGPHPVYWYILNGKRQLRVTLPNTHGGSDPVSTGFIKAIRNNLKINSQQLVDLIECPLSADEYRHIIQKILAGRSQEEESEE